MFCQSFGDQPMQLMDDRRFFRLFEFGEVNCMWRTIPCLTISTVLVLAADPSWTTKEVASWSEEDAVQVLTRSPWVAAATLTILPARSEAQSRDGGRMGGGRAAGLEALQPSILMGVGKASKGFASSIEKRKTLTVRWESALPVRSAEKKAGEDAPTWEGDYYAISVYGVPGLDVKGRVKGSHLGGAKGYHWGGAVLFCSRRDEPRRWESGKPAFGFPLFHPPSSPELWECGNLAVFWRDSQGARGKSGKPVFGFPCFPQPRHFHGSSSFG